MGRYQQEKHLMPKQEALTYELKAVIFRTFLTSMHQSVTVCVVGDKNKTTNNQTKRPTGEIKKKPKPLGFCLVGFFFMVFFLGFFGAKQKLSKKRIEMQVVQPGEVKAEGRPSSKEVRASLGPVTSDRTKRNSFKMC